MLVTRPEPDAGATVRALAALGHPGLAAPCQVVLPLQAGAPLPACAAVLLTSRNGVRALAARADRPHGPAFCVGDATAALAEAMGFAPVASAAGDARDLAALVARCCDPAAGPLLLATARGAGGPLAALLRADGFRVLRRTVYRVAPVPDLPAAARAALAEGRVGHVLFHAAGAAGVFVARVRKAGLAERLAGVEALSISAAAAAPLGVLSWRKTSWPARPTEAAMLELLGPRAPAAAPVRPA